MHLVLIHRYFWPDTPAYAHILRKVALRLADEGHRVTVLTCQPSYTRSVVNRAPARESLAPGVEVRRWSVIPDRRFAVLKILNVLLFCIRLLLSPRWLGRVDCVMAASAPPLAVAKVGSWLARRCKADFIYHKQDIYPEVVVATGILRSRMAAEVLRRLDARTERTAKRIVVLSGDMADTVRSRGATDAQIAVINNFDPWDWSSSDVTQPSDAAGLAADGQRPQLQVVFAGNLGRFQNLEVVVAVAVALRNDPRLAFHFFGLGALFPTIERAIATHRLSNVHLHGYQSPEHIADFMRRGASLGVVSLAPGVVRAAYPSKTLSYLRNGRPLLLLVEPDTELVRNVVAAGAGVHVDPLDIDGIATTLCDLAGRPEDLELAGKAASVLYGNEFSPERQLGLWVDLFETVGGRQAGGR